MKLLFNENVFRAQPDPFVCEIPGGLVMYVTGVCGVKAYFSRSLFEPWEYQGIVCQKEGYHEYWAPCMYYEDGWYYLYFSCREVGAHESTEALHVAKSKNPFGPFEQMKCLYECFSIDPHVVRTQAGLFLWFCMDRIDTMRVGTRVFVQKLSDPETPSGEAIEKVEPTFDEEIYMRNRYKEGEHWHTIEGPFWLEHQGWQYVMYSGACYQNDTYHIGYASAKSSESDLRKVIFEKNSNDGEFMPLLTKNKFEEGVGHHSVINWQGEYYAVYHARDYEENPLLLEDQRTARICKLSFENGVITAQLLSD